MALVPWRHKRKDGDLFPLAEMRQEMDRLFDSFMNGRLATWGDAAARERAWVPTLDVAQNDQEVTVRAEIPGVDPKDLDISISGNQLTVAGEKSTSTEQNDNDWHQVESHYGAFRRTIELPSQVDPNQVSAECSQGVLTIKLRKSQAAATKKIEVKSS